MSQVQTSRNTRALDAKSEKQSSSRILPYLNQHKVQLPKLKIRNRIHDMKNLETHVRRYNEKQQYTILSIRFASSQANERKIQEQLYIKDNQNPAVKNKIQQKQLSTNLPYLRYRKSQTPVEYLKNLGYNPDVKLFSQRYSDKVCEKKQKYLNKLQSLKRDLNSYTSKQGGRVDRNRIKIKILGEQIRRKIQRENILREQRKGNKILNYLLNSHNEIASV